LSFVSIVPSAGKEKKQTAEKVETQRCTVDVFSMTFTILP